MPTETTTESGICTEAEALGQLSALAHQGRLGLVRRLIQAGPAGLSAGALARFAEAGASTVSAQLLVLANARLVRSRRAGRHIYYSACFDSMAALLGFLMADCCCSRPEICRDAAQAQCS